MLPAFCCGMWFGIPSTLVWHFNWYTFQNCAKNKNFFRYAEICNSDVLIVPSFIFFFPEKYERLQICRTMCCKKCVGKWDVTFNERNPISQFDSCILAHWSLCFIYFVIPIIHWSLSYGLYDPYGPLLMLIISGPCEWSLWSANPYPNGPWDPFVFFFWLILIFLVHRSFWPKGPPTRSRGPAGP